MLFVTIKYQFIREPAFPYEYGGITERLRNSDSVKDKESSRQCQRQGGEETETETKRVGEGSQRKVDSVRDKRVGESV